MEEQTWGAKRALASFFLFSMWNSNSFRQTRTHTRAYNLRCWWWCEAHRLRMRKAWFTKHELHGISIIIIITLILNNFLYKFWAIVDVCMHLSGVSVGAYLGLSLKRGMAESSSLNKLEKIITLYQTWLIPFHRLSYRRQERIRVCFRKVSIVLWIYSNFRSQIRWIEWHLTPMWVLIWLCEGEIGFSM